MENALEQIRKEKESRPAKAPLPTLTPEQDAEVNPHPFVCSMRQEPLTHYFFYYLRQVTRVFQDRRFRTEFNRAECRYEDIIKLKPGVWLNDEIINFYVTLLEARQVEAHAAAAKAGRPKPIDAHIVNSFFYAKLAKDGYAKSRLARWTKKVSCINVLRGSKQTIDPDGPSCLLPCPLHPSQDQHI